MNLILQKYDDNMLSTNGHTPLKFKRNGGSLTFNVNNLEQNKKKYVLVSIQNWENIDFTKISVFLCIKILSFC